MNILLENQNLFLAGKITSGDTARVHKEIGILEKDSNIDVYFNSGGGSINEAFKIGHILSRNHIFRSFGEIGVHSAALLPFLLGYERYANKMTEFLFHLPVFDRDASKTERSQKIFNVTKFVSEQTQLDANEVQDLMEKNTRMSAQAARDCGIIQDFC
jgi:ATP-dependent protease ClpP protease subunit